MVFMVQKYVSRFQLFMKLHFSPRIFHIRTSYGCQSVSKTSKVKKVI